MAHARAARRERRSAVARPPRARRGHRQGPDEPRGVRPREAQAGDARRERRGRARRAPAAEQDGPQALSRPDRRRRRARRRVPALPHDEREHGVRESAFEAREPGPAIHPAGEEVKTRITELLGIEYPILQAAMSWASSNAPLVIAVSNAGGMGVLGAGPMRPEDFSRTLDEIKAGTRKPFGVNIPLNGARAAELLEIAFQKKIPVMVASQGGPREQMPRFHAIGTRWLHVVASVEHAKKAEAAGVDALVVDGAEAGGHPPPNQ